MESGSVDLQGVLAEFSDRVSRLPADLQRVFCEDLATAAENRICVLEKMWVAIFLSKPELGSQLESCHPGDLICCSWTDASIGKTSTNGGVIDVPVRSWGVFVGVFGKRKHIILAQNSFEYADGLCDLDYTAIPIGWIEDVQVIALQYVPEQAARSLVASFVRCDEEQKKVYNRSNRPRTIFQRRLSTHGWHY